MAQYDLSLEMCKYFDRHLVFPLLETLKEKDIYPVEEIMQAQLDLLAKTNMVDFAVDIYQHLNNTDQVPEEMYKRRGEVIARLQKLKADAAPIVQFFANEGLVRSLRSDRQFNLAVLKEHGLTEESIEALFNFAKFQFECGNYAYAAEYLHQYRIVCTESERNVSALWGELASHILLQQFGEALDILGKLREVLDNQLFAPPLMQIQQRAWLMHWALFVFWTVEDGRQALIDLFFQEKFLVALQINAAHLVRYLAVAIMTTKKPRRGSAMRDLLRLIQQESYEYRDPITEFLECVFVNYDFDGAQEKLKECEELIDTDFFLCMQPNCKEEFVDNARLHIFETYCRIHQCIDLGMLAKRLNMDSQTAERWIANLIRNARLNAKIDWTNGTVVMGMQYPSTFEQIVDKTRMLSLRTFQIANYVVGSGSL